MTAKVIFNTDNNFDKMGRKDRMEQTDGRKEERKNKERERMASFSFICCYSTNIPPPPPPLSDFIWVVLRELGRKDRVEQRQIIERKERKKKE